MSGRQNEDAVNGWLCVSDERTLLPLRHALIPSNTISSEHKDQLEREHRRSAKMKRWRKKKNSFFFCMMKSVLYRRACIDVNSVQLWLCKLCTVRPCVVFKEACLAWRIDGDSQPGELIQRDSAGLRLVSAMTCTHCYHLHTEVSRNRAGLCFYLLSIYAPFILLHLI